MKNTDFDEILNDIPDKITINGEPLYRNTTSKKFKLDVINFFNKEEFKNKNAIEIGVYGGHSTLILSKLFNHVHAIDIRPISSDIKSLWKKYNSNNITYHQRDVYKNGLPDVESDIFFIDAVHTYHAVAEDIYNSLKLKSIDKKYFIYDDYGAFPEIKKCIDDHCNFEKIKILKFIGYKPGDKFLRKLYDYEGLICLEL